MGWLDSPPSLVGSASVAIVVNVASAGEEVKPGAGATRITLLDDQLVLRDRDHVSRMRNLIISLIGAKPATLPHLRMLT